MAGYYNIDGEQITMEEAFELWGERNDERMVAADGVDYYRFLDGNLVKSEYYVSTVHLVLDHNYTEGPPLIFETLVMRGVEDETGSDPWDGYIDRYETKDQALYWHRVTIWAIQLGETPQSGIPFWSVSSAG